MSNRYLTTDEAGGGVEVHSITSTPASHSTDMGHRMKVYGIQMGLRVVCLIAFVVVDNIWVRGVCLVGVAVLPWMAVLLANRGADRSARTSRYYQPPEVPALPPPAPARPAEPAAIDVVLEGEFRAGHGDDDDARPAPGPGPAPSGRPADSDIVEDDRSRGAA